LTALCANVEVKPATPPALFARMIGLDGSKVLR
jgi:hypothetical protein